MTRLAHSALLLTAVLSSSCYLAHRIEDPEATDASVVEAIDGPLSPLIDPTCCLALACGDSEEACGADAECGARGCETACEGPRCGGVCCGAEQLCIAEACVDPGGPCSSDEDCGPEAQCDPVGRVCLPPLASGCFEPSPFAPEVQWEDTELQAITVPIVTQLTDDDGDGRIGASDVPDIVTIEVAPPRDPSECRLRPGGCPTAGPPSARLIAKSGDDGRTLWTAGDLFLGFCTHSTAAAGDLDGDGTVELVVFGRTIEPHRHLGSRPRGECSEPPEDPGTCPVFPPDRGDFHDHGASIDSRFWHYHRDSVCSGFHDAPGSVLILSHEGVVEREVQLPFPAADEPGDTILIADLDADGSAEVIAGGVVIGAEGVRWSDARLASVDIAVGDIDLDGRLEIVTAQHAFEDDGTLKWTDDTMAPDGHPAIARVLAEPTSTGPQVIVVDGERLVVRDGRTGRALVGPSLFAAGISSGPPTIADFDGDGVAEIAVAADHAFVLFDLELRAPHVRWQVESEDQTPGTVGSAAFDFDGDGADDVAYSDECHVTILSGRDGNPLWTQSSPSLTVWEYPVVADVDGDGHAELLVVSNGEGTACPDRTEPFRMIPSGLRVFRDRLGNWGPTLRSWNQHGYARAIDDAGRLPTDPPRSWETHNTVRANPHLGDRGRRLPDLRVTAQRLAVSSCGGDEVILEARVENRGNTGVLAGVEVAFGPLTVARTSRVLLPGGAEWVRSTPIARSRLLAATPLEIRADPRDLHVECDEHDYGVPLALQCTTP